jgi:peptidase E
VARQSAEGKVTGSYAQKPQGAQRDGAHPVGKYVSCVAHGMRNELARRVRWRSASMDTLFHCVWVQRSEKMTGKRKAAILIPMKRLILFSLPTEPIKQQLVPLLFPDEIRQKVFAYMPCEGVLRGEHYAAFTKEWQALAQQHQAEFVLIDTASANAAQERTKLRRANILFITGGNSCVLLRNLRRSGLDQIIMDLAQKEHWVFAGYSAGAMIFTPSVELAAFDSRDNDEAGLTDFRALHFVDYEIAPHYTDEYKEILEAYKRTRPYEVRPVTDAEYIVIDR